jgi:hypothetical protein
MRLEMRALELMAELLGANDEIVIAPRTPASRRARAPRSASWARS